MQSVQDLNSCHRVQFLRRYPLHHEIHYKIVVMLAKERRSEHKKVDKKTYIFKLEKQDTSEPG